MNVLDARELAANIPEDRRHEFIDIGVWVGTDEGEADCWVDAADAGLLAIGWLAGIEDERELMDGIRHVGYLHHNGLMDMAEWEKAGYQVIDALMDWGDKREEAAAPSN